MQKTERTVLDSRQQYNQVVLLTQEMIKQAVYAGDLMALYRVLRTAVNTVAPWVDEQHVRAYVEHWTSVRQDMTKLLMYANSKEPHIKGKATELEFKVQDNLFRLEQAWYTMSKDLILPPAQEGLDSL